MKKVSAFMIILAVLNPLCCCFTFADEQKAEDMVAKNHACCNEESESTASQNPSHNPDECSHEALKASVHAADTLVAPQNLPTFSYLDQAIDTKLLIHGNYSAAIAANMPVLAVSVPSWVGIQVDCVRRL